MSRITFLGPATRADADLDNKRIGRDNFYNNDFGHPLRNFGTQSAGNLVFGGVAGQAGSIQSGWFRAYVRFRNLPSAEKSFLTLGHTASATPGVHFSITTAGKLRIYNTHTIVANSVLIVESTGSMNIAADETGWNKLEGFVLYSASVANTGSVIFFLNGVQLYSGPFVDAGEGINRVGLWDTLDMQSVTGDVTVTGMDLDWSNVTVDNSDRIEDTQVTLVPITGNGFYQNWAGLNPDWKNRRISYGVVAGSSGGVEDVSTTNLSSRQSYTVPLLSSLGITGNILGIRVVGRIGISVNAQTGQLFIRRNGVDIDASSTYTFASGSTPFTWARFDPTGFSISDTLEIGFRSGAGAGTYRWKELELIVEHDSPVVPPPVDQFQVLRTNYTGTGALQAISLPFAPDFIIIWPRTTTARGTLWWNSCLTFKTFDANAGNTRKIAQIIDGDTLALYDADAACNAVGVVYDVILIRDTEDRVFTEGSFVYDTNIGDTDVPVPFTPEAVVVFAESDGSNLGNGQYYLYGPGQAADATLQFSASAVVAGRIQALGTNKFTIKNGMIQVNDFQFPWFALNPAGIQNNRIVDIVNWTGDGTASRNIALNLGGQIPVAAFVFQQAAAERYFRNDQMADSRTIAAAGTSATAITGFAADQLQIGVTINTGAVVYTAIVFVEGIDSGGNNQYSGIYFLDPTARHDTVWDRTTLPVTTNLKIPNPTYRTHFVGERDV